MKNLEEEAQDNIGRIREIGIVDEMRKSYLNYAMSVIVSRALPDVRDGLKPVHRRILYAMYKLNLFYKGRFSKSAKVVGEVLGKYHPHSDTAVYDAIVRLAQDFSMRYPLVYGQGNFGSIDGDPPAAMRYTEVKLTKIAGELLEDIDRDTVMWADNFDATLKEPLTLPAKLPNLLLMGAEGIAVGMATKIPPHNLAEIVDSIVTVIDQIETSKDTSVENGNESSHHTYKPPRHEEFLVEELASLREEESKRDDEYKPQHIHFTTTLDTLMKHVRGPDFPTAGSIYGIDEIQRSYATGKGRILMRAHCEHEEATRGKESIIVTELPYQVNKSSLIQKIAELVKDKKVSGISDLRDESDQDGIRIVIELKRETSYNRLLNNLYKHTDLQTSFPVNMVALVNNTPQTVSLRTVLEEYLKHRILVIKRRSIWELKSAKRRAHILEGLLKALDHIDEIIAIIKKSKNEEIARETLMKTFSFTQIQAQSILDMQLKKLTGLEKAKIEDELKSLRERITELETLVGSVFYILAEIKREILELKKTYGDKRKTRVFNTRPGELSDEQLIENKEVIITLTQEGYIKSVPRDTFKVQKRGGKGVAGFSTKEEDSVYCITSAMNHDHMLYFTNKGKVYQTRVWEIPSSTRTSKGKALVNVLSLEGGEHVTSILSYTGDMSENDKCIVFMCTRRGTVKKTLLSQFKNITVRGIIAIRLEEKDELQWVQLTSSTDRVIIATQKGKAIVFNENNVRPMGRATKGVRGINLKKDDRVTSMDIIDPKNKDLSILVLSKKGIGKKSKISLFPIQRRGGQGVKIATVDTKTGDIAFSSVINNSARDTLLITSQKGQVVKIPMKGIPTLTRTAKGVIVMRFSQSNDSVASSTFL